MCSNGSAPENRVGFCSFHNVTQYTCLRFTIKSMYIHLTAHSAFSLQEGLIPPIELAQAAEQHGMQALGLTDHNLLSGVVEFAQACREKNIQPIIGLEIEHGKRHALRSRFFHARIAPTDRPIHPSG